MIKTSSCAMVFFCFFAFCNAEAAIFNAANVAELQSALTEAQSNGQEDTIILASGLFPVSSPLEYFPADIENYSLTIQGAGAEITVLDGGNATAILQIEQRLVLEGTNTDVTIRGVTFRNGSESSLLGGALYVGNSNAQTTIEDSSFRNNTAVFGGGAVCLYLEGGGSHVVRNTFAGNSSTDLSSVGGAVYAEISGGTLSIEGNTFVGNFSVGSGAGFYGTDSGPIVLTGNTFTSNVAGGEGGGAYLSAQFGGSLTLSGNTFSANSGSSSGGVALASDTGPIIISGNIFRNNIASASSESNGGGLTAFTGFSGSSLTMVNNLFVGNTTSQRGAGAMVHLFSNENSITNNTFAGNSSTTVQGSSQGGGMYVITDRNEAILNIYNNIFWGNTAMAPSHRGADFYINDDGLNDGVGSTIKVYNNDYSEMEVLRGTLLFQGGNINADPMFDGDYRLTPGSPCMDTGSNSAPGLVVTDLGGDPRLQDGKGMGTAIVDMGAYEWWPRGGLHVTISPQGVIDGGAKWRVDGGFWQVSGYTQSLLVGSHTVQFRDVAGWTTPGDQSVTIDSGQTTSAVGIYTATGETGSLEVTINPQGAIDGGAKWQVDGGVWQDSGYTQTGLSAGEHTVWFSDVPGLTKPANQTVMILAGQMANTSGAYTGHIGSLRVTITPQQAINAGAHWQVDGGVWHISGETQTVSAGTHTVTFSDVLAWRTPGDQAVTINEGQTTNAGGIYTQPTGSLRVTISPQGAIDGGAKWQVDGGVWHVSGETQAGLPVGSHTVEFSDVPGWTTPGNRTVTVSEGHTTNASGSYTPLPLGSLTVTITPQGAIDEGAQWRVDGGDWQASGYMKTGLLAGEHTLAFRDVMGWAKPGDRVVTIESGKTTAISEIYAVVTATGSLQVTISPQGAIDAGAKWRRIGTPTWLASGATETGILVFQYTVEFSDVSGWTNPGNQAVTVSEGQTTIAGGTYEPVGPTGFLQVTIAPQEAINAGAHWRVDEGVWQVSGYTQAGLSVGLHTLWFSDVPGWNTPGNQMVTISEGLTTSMSGVYAPQTGSLQVNIIPQEAVDAGGQWRRVGTTTWLASGAVETGILVGSHTVEFNDAPNWWKPGNIAVTIGNNQTTVTAGTYIPHTGSLQLILAPQEAIDAGARWRRVGESIWRNSGTTESGIPVGLQTVEFSPAVGWTKPENQTVTIIVNETATSMGTYTPPSGSLQVTINPQGVIDAGAQWQVDGGTWHGSGEMQTRIPVGMHTLAFSTVTGWTKPGNRTVTITNGNITTLTGTYSPQTGSLRVTIVPQGAIDAGAKWRRVGTSAWLASGETETGIFVGVYTLEFSDVPEWMKPDIWTVTISYGRTTTATGTYTPRTGSLQVTISPQGAIDAGAKWRVDGGTWQASGYTQPGLSVGQHTVEFKDVSNWTKPGSLAVMVNDSQTTHAEGTYAPPSGSLRVTISPQGAIDAGAHWRVNGGPWQVSGYTQTGVPVGPQTVEFDDVPGWKKPANRIVTISNGRTSSLTGTYGARTGSLQVILSPQGAIDAGAKWRRLGTGTWRSSGSTESGVQVGQHTVEFSTVGGWAKPDNQPVVIIEGQTAGVSGTYAPPSGSLQVTISPQGAIDAGAQWRVDGGPWQGSGYTQTGLSVGLHTVSFSTVTGWTKPGNRTVTVKNGQTTAVTGTYTP